MPKLIIREQGTERIYKIVDEITTIGRTQDNNIPIKDPRSSRKHCQIVETADGYKVYDMKSRNGIFVNGKPAKEEMLTPGSKIEIGDTIIFFEQVPKGSKSAPRAKKRWVLKVTSGPEKGAQFILGSDPVLIGSHAAADMQLIDTEIATHHAQVILSDKTYTLVDLNTESGTFINGKKITKAALKPGMVITIGESNIRVAEASADSTGFQPAMAAPEEKPKKKGKSDRQKKAKSDRQKKAKSDRQKKKKEDKAKKAKKARPPVIEEPDMDEPDELDLDAPDEEDVIVTPSTVSDDIEMDAGLDDSGFPSQADFEAVDLEGMVENSNTTAILTTVAISVFFVLFLFFGISFIIEVFHTPPPDPKPKDSKNLVVNWSFENQTENQPASWKLQDGAGLDKEQFLGGKSSLRLEGSNANVPGAVSEKIGVSDGKYYILRAYLRLEAAGPSGMRLHWTKDGTSYSQTTYTPLWEGTNDWKEITAIVVPPKSADRVQIECITLGQSGIVWFDRVGLEERGDRSQAEVKGPFYLGLDEDLILQLDGLGQMTLYQGDPPRMVFDQGQIQILDLEENSLSRQVLVKVVEGPTFQQEKFYIKGKLFHKKSGTWHAFTQTVEEKDEQIVVNYQFEGKVPLEKMGFRIRRRKGRQVQLVGKTTGVMGKETFTGEEIQEMIWGEGANKVVFLYPTPIKIDAKPLKSGTRVYQTVENTNRLTFSFSKSSQLEREKEKKNLEAVSKLEGENRLEEALEMWRKIRRESEYNKSLQTRAEQKIREIKDVYTGYKRELENLKSDYQSFQSKFILDSSRQKLLTIQKSFPSLGKKANKIMAELAELDKKRTAKNDTLRAKKLLRKGKQILGSQLESEAPESLALAAAYYREIIRHYEQSNPLIVREAKLKLKLIREKMDHLLRKIQNQ